VIDEEFVRILKSSMLKELYAKKAKIRDIAEAFLPLSNI
jgi:hypothetical protein